MAKWRRIVIKGDRLQIAESAPLPRLPEIRYFLQLLQTETEKPGFTLADLDCGYCRQLIEHIFRLCNLDPDLITGETVHHLVLQSEDESGQRCLSLIESLNTPQPIPEEEREEIASPVSRQDSTIEDFVASSICSLVSCGLSPDLGSAIALADSMPFDKLLSYLKERTRQLDPDREKKENKKLFEKEFSQKPDMLLDFSGSNFMGMLGNQAN